MEHILDAWISQLYMASMIRGDQSRNPCEMDSRTVRIASPVRRPMSGASFSLGRWMLTSSRITAMPCTGSWHSGPCAVASWKAYVILSERSRTVMPSSVVVDWSALLLLLGVRLKQFTLAKHHRVGGRGEKQKKKKGLQFLARVRRGFVHQNIRPDTPRSKGCNPIHDVPPYFLVFHLREQLS